MGNGSPTAYLLWAILSCIYLVFLLLHLWHYDRFQCLRWDSGRQPGAFKRVMTYSYLGTVPLLVIFSIAITVIKFKEGFLMTPNGTIIPRPYSRWDSANSRWILPLYFVLSVAWSLEHVTHLEELTFWVFLLNQGPGKREWFASWEFRIWTIGSFTTLTGMPTTVLSTRHNVDTCLAYIFLVGSLVGTTTTVFFLYVLGRFPWFIRHVKKEGAEPDVVVRLATFYQLNRIRVLFRFLFTVPLLIIALDGLTGPYPIIGDPFALDFLLMMGGIGCFISSAITLLIFFPRSITRESGYQTKPSSPQNPYVMKLHPLQDFEQEHQEHHHLHLHQQRQRQQPFELEHNQTPSTPALSSRYREQFMYNNEHEHEHKHEHESSQEQEHDLNQDQLQDQHRDQDRDQRYQQYQFHTSSSSTTRYVSSSARSTTVRRVRRSQRAAYPALRAGVFVAPDAGEGEEDEGEDEEEGGEEEAYVPSASEDYHHPHSRMATSQTQRSVSSHHPHPHNNYQTSRRRGAAGGSRRDTVLSRYSFTSGETSPGYESDADTERSGVNMYSSVVLSPLPHPPPLLHPEQEPERDRAMKGSREGHAPSSDDTVWERGEHLYEPSLAHVQESVREENLGGLGQGRGERSHSKNNLVGVGSGTGGLGRTGSGSGSGSGGHADFMSNEVTITNEPNDTNNNDTNNSTKKKRRRHSGGPFSFDESGRLVSPGIGPVKLGFGGIGIGFGVGIGMSVGMDMGMGINGSGSGRGKMRAREGQERYYELEQGSVEGGGERGGLGKSRQRRGERERAIERARVREESALHPYLIHFTSPIDLHDGQGVRLTRSERGQARRPPV